MASIWSEKLPLPESGKVCHQMNGRLFLALLLLRFAVFLTAFNVGTVSVAESTADSGSERFEFELRDNIEYAKVGDLELLLDAYVPEGEGPYPAVLVIHGGAWMSGSKDQLRFYARALAQRGYVAFANNNRLAPAHKFPAQIDDCRSAPGNDRGCG